MNTVLIVVPTLDSYHLLPRLVDSLKAQTVNCWRVLFVDGKSSLIHRKWLDDLCIDDPRFQWISQKDCSTGIYGAMNEGWQLSTNTNEWVFFWGSDDYAASENSLKIVIEDIRKAEISEPIPDLLVFSARYYSLVNGMTVFSRSSRFSTDSALRDALFWGFSPPHQATLFGPSVKNKISSFNSSFRIAADLDYFLRLSLVPKVRITRSLGDIVYMGSSGISGQYSRLRFLEVMGAYKKSFPVTWIIPFASRYIRRLKSVIEK